MTAADQPTTEPSVCGAPNPGDGAGGPCLRSPGHGGIHFNTVRGWPLAPAPQPAADTEGVRHFAPWGSYRASCGVEVPRGASEDTGFTFRRDRTTCPDCRSHFTNPADTEVQWGVRRLDGTHFKASSRDGADRVIAGRGDEVRVRRVATKTTAYTPWEEA